MNEKDIFSQIDILERQGVKEIVLTGIHIGYYGKDLSPELTLLDIIKKLCKSFPNIYFRLSSIEPTELDLEFLKFIRDCPNFCNHLHIPLQSGSDKVLLDMNRRYNASFYKELIYNIKEIIPDCAIGTDVMTGFPTETEEDFKKTFELIKSLPISYLHAFPYSPRPGTVASCMKRYSTQKEAKKRAKKLIDLGRKKKIEFYKSFINKELSVLFERPLNQLGNYYQGHSQNYILVRVRAYKDIKNKVLKVKIQSLFEEKNIELLGCL